MQQRWTVANALAAIRKPAAPAGADAAAETGETATFSTLFTHGSMQLEIYQPQQVDRQQPHTQDELYVIAAGRGFFVCDGRERQAVEVGEVLFVPAGVAHRFEDFSDDFATWVIFYGRQGGEAAQRETDVKLGSSD